jgi:hypothetical protein
MEYAKSIQTCLLVLTFFVCLNSNDIPARDCAPPFDCPPNLSTIQETVQFPRDWHFEWDWINSAKEIEDNHTANVYVIGGQAPYSWTVGGHDGFSLDQPVTAGVANQLINDGACGTATISVTDARGIVVTGQVRSTKNSSWQQVGGKPNCQLSGAADWAPSALDSSRTLTLTRTQGGKKQHEKISVVSGASGCESGSGKCAEVEASCDCNSAACTDDGLGCTNCLDWPDEASNTSYSCRWAGNWNLAFYGTTTYCHEFQINNASCARGPYYCGDGSPNYVYGGRCYCSSEVYYEEWRCE